MAALLDAVRRRTPAVSPVSVSRPAGAETGTVATALQQTLRDRLASLVAGVDPDDAAALATVVPALVREVLAEQFGSALRDLAEAPSMCRRLEDELARESYRPLWVDLVRSLRA